MSSNILEARAVTKEYARGRIKALDGLDLELRQGDVVGLLGPNGAGKTTFVRCALGLQRPTSGEVRLFGLAPSNPEARVSVGYSPETPHFPRHLSGAEILRFHTRLLGLPAGQARSQIDALLDQSGLSGAPNRIAAYSKGMLQRLSLAQSLLGDPKLLILDEPTGDLDPIGRRDVRNILHSLKHRGVTVLLNSHLLSEVERTCDRVIIIDHGRTLAQGTIDELVPEGKDLEDVFVDLVEGAR